MNTDAAEEQRTRVVLDLSMVHLFDRETGEDVAHGLTDDSDDRRDDSDDAGDRPTRRDEQSAAERNA